MSANVARGHGDDGGDDDRPLSYQVRAPESLILVAGKRAGRIPATDKSGPVQIRFEVDDGKTLMPLGDHAAHWANYLGELVREFPLYYPSWRQMPPERKAEVVAKIGTQFELCPHMKSDRWPQIYVGIQQHLQKIYNGKKAALKERYWVPEEDETYDPEHIRRGRPSHIFEVDWDAQLTFWNDPKNLARAAQNKQNRAKNKAVYRQGSQSITSLRDMHMETSATRKYPSLIHTFFLTHTVGGVFLNPEDKALNMTTSSTNNSVFRGFFEKQKLTGPNFINWYRQLMIELSIEDKLNYLEQPIPPAPVAPAGQHVAPEILAAHNACKQIRSFFRLREIFTLVGRKKGSQLARNGQCEAVEAIGAFYLCLPSGLEIVLNNCHYAPSITRGVISVSCLYEDDFVNRFVDNTIQVSRNNVVYFSAVPRDGIFEIDLSNSLINKSSIYAVSNKRAKLDLDSALLWHC
nr:hypothetical protein [Tanacetum cinerariifolium]